MTTSYILSSYFYTNSREDTQLPQFYPQVYQDNQEPTPVPKYGDNMDGLEDRVEDEDSLENRTDEQRFDNMYLQDVYYNLPRSMNYWYSVINVDLIIEIFHCNFLHLTASYVDINHTNVIIKQL